MAANQANIDLITNVLQDIGYLGSIQEARILAILIAEPNFSTVKDICDIAGVPDSKIYPAIKELEALNLIQRDPNTRPNRFYFSNPAALEEFLNGKFNEESEKKKSSLKKLEEILRSSWNPHELELGPIAHLARGKDIFNEILRVLKRTERKLFFLFSPAFEQYAEFVVQELPPLLEKGIKVELAYPKIKSFEEKLLPLASIQSPLLQIKRYMLFNSSYMVSDEKVMLNIIHQRIGDVSMLTDDQLLVSAIDACWEADACCAPYDPSDSILNLDMVKPGKNN